MTYPKDSKIERCPNCGEDLFYELKLGVEGLDALKVKSLCACERIANESLEAEIRENDRKLRVQKNKQIAFPTKSFFEKTFANDKKPKSRLSKLCKNFVRNFHPQKSRGLLLAGSVGVGKSFYAACIANELLEKGYKVRFISLPQYLNQVYDLQNKEEYLAEILRANLLIIDDLGVERSTDYALEQSFNLINAWSLEARPLIVTTNLSPEAMRKEEGIEKKRIYDRILGMTVPVLVKGQSMRGK